MPGDNGQPGQKVRADSGWYCLSVCVCREVEHPSITTADHLNAGRCGLFLFLLAQGGLGRRSMVLNTLALSISAHSAPALNTVISSLTLRPSHQHPPSSSPHFTSLQTVCSPSVAVEPVGSLLGHRLTVL